MCSLCGWFLSVKWSVVAGTRRQLKSYLGQSLAWPSKCLVSAASLHRCVGVWRQVHVPDEFQVIDGQLVIDCGGGMAVGLPAMSGALA